MEETTMKSKASICIEQMAILEKNVNAVYTQVQSRIESGAEFCAEHLISAEQYESIKAKYIPHRDNLSDMIKAIQHNSLRAVWVREYSEDDNPWVPAPDPLTEKEKELVQTAMEYYYDF